jgi:hypothetical protein
MSKIKKVDLPEESDVQPGQRGDKNPYPLETLDRGNGK